VFYSGAIQHEFEQRHEPRVLGETMSSKCSQRAEQVPSTRHTESKAAPLLTNEIMLGIQQRMS